MTPETHGRIPILVVTATIGLSILLFLASLFFPAFNLSYGRSFGGLSTLLMGWMGSLPFLTIEGGEIGFLGWYANLFFFPAWLGMAFAAKFRAAAFVGVVFTFAGIGVALCSVLVKRILMTEAGGTAVVTSMGAGFYLWLGSLAVCALGYSSAIVWSFVKPNLMIANHARGGGGEDPLVSRSRILGYHVERTENGIRLRLHDRADAVRWSGALAVMLTAGPVAAMLGPFAGSAVLLVGGIVLSATVAISLSRSERGSARRPRALFAGRSSTGEVILEIDGEVRPACDVCNVVQWRVPPMRVSVPRRGFGSSSVTTPEVFHVYVVLIDEVLDLGSTSSPERAAWLASCLADALGGTVTERHGAPPQPLAAPVMASMLLAAFTVAAAIGSLIASHELLGAVADGPDLVAAAIVGALSLVLVSVALLLVTLFEPLAVRGAERAASRRFGVGPSVRAVFPRPSWLALGASLLAVALGVLAASPLLATEHLRASCAAGNAAACDPFGERGVPRRVGSAARAVPAPKPEPLPAPIGETPTIDRPLESGSASALTGVPDTATASAGRGLQLSCAFSNGWFVLVPSLLVVEGETSSDPYGDYRAFFREMALSDDWLQSASVGADWFEPHAARRCPRRPTLVETDSGRHTLLVVRRGRAESNGHAESVTIDARTPTTLRFESAALDETWTCNSCE